MTASRARSIGGATVVATVAGVFAAAAFGASGARPAHVAPCTTSRLEVWLGDGEGGGTAGRTYDPIEFTNVGHAACTLYGYPGISAWGLNGAQVGVAATKTGQTPATVTLAPKATAHVIVAFVDWGAVCATAANALGLKIYPPGQTAAQDIDYPLQVCASKSVLVTGPVKPGVGIPGYTAP
jgi:hypothetical protein